MDFSTLIDQKVTCTATVSKIIKNDRNGNDRIVFEDLHINGAYFRDHTFVNMDKRLSNLKCGDNVSFTATLIEYHGYVGDKKLGINLLRHVAVGGQGVK